MKLERFDLDKTAFVPAPPAALGVFEVSAALPCDQCRRPNLCVVFDVPVNVAARVCLECLQRAVAALKAAQ